jgi:phosphatidylglycerol---prolipoprotein diacylglyceryl transferase
MRRVLFRLRGLAVPSYPALLYVGIVVGLLGARSAAVDALLPPTRVLAASVMLLVPALTGARVLFVALHWRTYGREPARILRPSDGGAALFGGLMLALVASVPLLSLLRLPFARFWDIAVLPLSVGLAVTRIGCLLHGCCAGRPTRAAVGLRLPDARRRWCQRLPTPLFESLLGLTIAVAAWWTRHHQMPAGSRICVALLAYCGARFALERTRAPARGAIWQRRIALAGIVAGVLGLFTVWT